MLRCSGEDGIIETAGATDNEPIAKRGSLQLGRVLLSRGRRCQRRPLACL